MTLRPQPRRPTRRPPARRPHRPGGRRWPLRRRGAGRPGTPIRGRVIRRLPSLARLTAALGAVASAAGFAALLNGPWVVVTDVAYAGQHYTEEAVLAEALEGARGMSVLAVDTEDVAARIEALPAVADAVVETALPGAITATVVEHEVAFIWVTRTGRYLGADDGTLFAVVADGDELPAGLSSVPLIDDRRSAAWLVTVGDVIPETTLRTALRIVDLDPAHLGSESDGVALVLDDAYGFRLLSASPEWEVALGAYGADPTETDAEAAARLERQVAAVRTLFAEREEDDIAWVDVRNPGKVYFRAKG